MMWLESHTDEYLAALDKKRCAQEIGWSRDRVSRTLDSLTDLGLPADVLTFVEAPVASGDDSDEPLVGLPWMIVAVVAALAAIVLLFLWSRSGSSAAGASTAMG